MKIVITGGAGYIGAALTEKLCLLPEVEEIRIFDNLSTGNLDFFFNTKLIKEKIKFTEGDILETRKLKKLVVDADVVVHLASIDFNSTDNASIHQLEQVNHWGTAELSYAVENSDVKNFIFVSSAKVYGYSDEIKTEDSIPNATNPFAASKMRAESHIQRLSEKMSTIVLRPGIVTGFGPVKSNKGVPNKLMFDALVKKRVSIHGDGNQTRPIVSLSHIINVLENAVLFKMQKGIYNVSQENMSVLDILEELKKLIPDSEFIFTNHHLTLPSIKLSSVQKHGLSNVPLHIGHEFEDILKHVKL